MKTESGTLVYEIYWFLIEAKFNIDIEGSGDSGRSIDAKLIPDQNTELLVWFIWHSILLDSLTE